MMAYMLNYPTIPRYIQAIYRSFYSSALFAEIGTRWKGWGIVYLLFIISLASLPWAVRITMNFNQLFVNQVMFPMTSLPPVSIVHGELQFKKPMPFLIKNAEGQIVSVIDTTGSVNEMNDAYPYLSILMTKHRLYFRFPAFKQFAGITHSLVGNKIDTQELSFQDHGTFDSEYWIKRYGIKTMQHGVQIIIFPLLILFFGGLYSCFILIFSTLGQWVTDIFWRFKLPFKDTCRLLAVACTPQIMGYFMIRTLQIPLPGLGLYSLVLFILYFFYAMYSVSLRAHGQRGSMES